MFNKRNTTNYIRQQTTLRNPPYTPKGTRGIFAKQKERLKPLFIVKISSMYLNHHKKFVLKVYHYHQVLADILQVMNYNNYDIGNTEQ